MDIDVLIKHLALKNPRFLCRHGSREVVVSVTNSAGDPASESGISALHKIAGDEAPHLIEIYSMFDGISFHETQETASLVIPSIESLETLREEVAEWHDLMDDVEKMPFEIEGIPFATIDGSGNYFTIYGGRIYYLDHDDRNEEMWSESIHSFILEFVTDPPAFLKRSGSYTRYYDDQSDDQFIPEVFLHD